MNNFELHQNAEEMSDKHSVYVLSRMYIESQLEQDKLLDELMQANRQAEWHKAEMKEIRKQLAHSRGA